jgi:protease YdgD
MMTGTPTRLFGILLAAAAMVGAIPVCGAQDRMPGIAGSDDRVIVDSGEWPWAAIGRVNFGGRGFCTGTLVASDVVLTAAHCLFDQKRDRWYRHQEVTFLAGYRRGEAGAIGRARTIVVPPAFRQAARPSLDRIANDWALVVLREPLPVKPLPVRPLAEASAPSDHPQMLCASYGQDRAHLLSVHRGCEISGRMAEGKVLVHTCDATRGGSGAPLFVVTDDGPGLVGLVVGHLEGDKTPRSFAVDVNSVVNALSNLARIP